MIILFINNISIDENIHFIHHLFIEYEIKIIFIKNNNTILEEIKKKNKNHFIFIDYINKDLFKIIKFVYNISIYLYSNDYTQELIEELNDFYEKMDFNFFTHNKKYKYIKSIPINYFNENNIKLTIDDIFYKNKKVENKGFIVLTHVNDEKTNKLWNHNIFKIRQYHNHKIVIINDNSSKEYLKLDNELFKNNDLYFDINELQDIEWIQSEYPKRGEILPYYYLYKKKLFEQAIIIHDSTFIQKKYNIDTNNIDYLWHFEHHANDYINEINMIEKIENKTLIESYDAKKWYGCFGCQTIINYTFIKEVQDKYNIFKLLDFIDSRSKRMNFERIFSILCTEINNELYNKKSIYGNILEYQDWGLAFQDYIKFEGNYKKKDLIKTWCGR